MTATLPMYDWPDLMPVTDRFWVLIRDRLRDNDVAAPDSLNRNCGLWDVWESPELVLSQTCGMPYRVRLHGNVSLIGTPDYALPGAPAGYYYSQFVVRARDPGEVADFAGRTLAFNGQDSQSGWAAAQNHAAGLGFRFRHTLHTGAHRDSARAVADGRADIAAIDAITWRLICRFLPEIASDLRVVCATEPTPGLPLISALGTDIAPHRAAFAAAIEALSPKDRKALGVTGLAQVPATAYLCVPTPPPPSQDAAGN